MGKVVSPKKVKLIVAVFTSKIQLFPEIEKSLKTKYGDIDFESDVFNFDYTDYYKEEMGGCLKKKFISFKNLINPEIISSIKLFTNKLEHKNSLDNKRLVNIDPGYLSESKLVLASTKNFYHRIYLKEGIYAEVTLYFKEGRFQPLPWTYPDYKVDKSIDIFNRIREIYKKQLANL
jgi:hypothetical protein